MANNSRPDIQVLEARVKRIKAQLQEYRDLRLYEITKKRLSNVSSELEECMCLIHEIVGATPQQTISTEPEPIALKEPEQLTNSNDFEDDLSDLLSLELPEPVDYSPKLIVSSYSKRIRQCREQSTGIIQINQFCSMLDSWYQARYNPEIKNTKFHYKSQRIHEWIDLLILAAGDAIRSKMFTSFKADVDDWISTLNSPRDGNWVLPKQVMKFNSHDADQCTKEAVLIEKVVKSMLYDESFYGDQMHSVEEIVMHSNRFTRDEMSISNILSTCPGFIKTSSFDATKYEVGG